MSLSQQPGCLGVFGRFFAGQGERHVDSVTASPPERIAINHDDDHAEHVGRTADGRQFFLTAPFEPQMDGRAGNEFVALYLFDAAGKLLEARIDEFGPRDTLDKAQHKAVYQQRLEELGDVTFQRIEIAPFVVERFGSRFGLIPLPPKDEEDVWAVEVQPGNYMAFFEPFDSGMYDT